MKLIHSNYPIGPGQQGYYFLFTDAITASLSHGSPFVYSLNGCNSDLLHLLSIGTLEK
jgi:hypothetical protein